MSKITIHLEGDNSKQEEYEKNDKNIIRARIRDSDGEMVYRRDMLIEITLSNDGMIGLATELLRAAYKKQINNWHMFPMSKHNIVKCLGVYTHPESCQILFSRAEFGEVEEIIPK